MAARIIDGKAFAEGLRERVAGQAAVLKQREGSRPGLATVLVGDDPASQIYVRNKGRDAEGAGMRSLHFGLAETASEAEVIARVRALNDDPEVHGILVQLPLPSHIDPHRVIDAIDPEKDVDGLHVINQGRLFSGRTGMVPCTPMGVMMLIKDLRDDLTGLKALVIGRSMLVGKPMAQLLLAENCTVTTAHSRTRDLARECRDADILVAAAGQPRLVRGDWVKSGAIVIDVGMNRIPSEKRPGKTRLVGDVAYAQAKEVAGAITPVPGGVGPMTIACLLQNTVIAFCRQRGLALPEAA